ncbi:hypothetical protein IFR05_007384 [Cadophora sp. M221]|nr:hypothetical protein IFR05_007384 [Cadophora sp. M221]
MSILGSWGSAVIRRWEVVTAIRKLHLSSEYASGVPTSETIKLTLVPNKRSLLQDSIIFSVDFSQVTSDDNASCFDTHVRRLCAPDLSDLAHPIIKTATTAGGYFILLLSLLPFDADIHVQTASSQHKWYIAGVVESRFILRLTELAHEVVQAVCIKDLEFEIHSFSLNKNGAAAILYHHATHAHRQLGHIISSYDSLAAPHRKPPTAYFENLLLWLKDILWLLESCLSRECSVKQSWKTLYAGDWWLSQNMDLQESMTHRIELDYREKVEDLKSSISQGSSFWDKLRFNTFSGLEAQELTVDGAIFVILRDRLLRPHYTRAIDLFRPIKIIELLVGLLKTYFEDISMSKNFRSVDGKNSIIVIRRHFYYLAQQLWLAMPWGPVTVTPRSFTEGLTKGGLHGTGTGRDPGEELAGTNATGDPSSPSIDLYDSKTEADAEPKGVSRDMYELLVCSSAWWELTNEFTKVLEIKTQKAEFKSRGSVVCPTMTREKFITVFGDPKQLPSIPTIIGTECAGGIVSNSDSASNLEPKFPQDQTADRTTLGSQNSIKPKPLASFVGENSDDDGSVSESGFISASATQAPNGWYRDHPITRHLFDPIRDMLLGRPLSSGIYRLEWMCECGHVGYDDYATTKEAHIAILWTHGVPTKVVTATWNRTVEFRRRFKSRQSSRDRSMFPLIQSVATNPAVTTAATNTTQTTSLGTQSIQMGVIGAASPSTGNTHPGPKVFGGVSSAIQLASTDPKYLLFCLDSEDYRVTQELAHIDVCDTKSDQQLFEELKANYTKSKAGLKTKPNTKNVKEIHFIKFELFPKSKIGILDYKQLPPPKKRGKEYEWEHHPPVVSSLALHWFDNPEDAGNSTIFVRRFPKTIRERLETVEHVGWGIYFEDRRRRSTVPTSRKVAVLVVTAIGVLASLVFGVLWTLEKGDIQGTYGVTGYIVAAFALIIFAVGYTFPEKEI